MLMFKYRDGVLPNLLVFTYLVFGFPVAFFLLSQPAGWLPGVLLLAHVWVIAAYLLHDCAHNAVFAKPHHNARLGGLLSWLCGSCYTSYAQLREKHFRHHVQREDVLAIDAHAWLHMHPRTHAVVVALTRCHLPAFDMLTHGLAIAAPFLLPALASQRRYTAGVLFLRVTLWLVLAVALPTVAAGYAVAWVLFIAVLNFMDTNQHSYDIRYTLLEPAHPPRFDAEYEQANTRSNLLSTRFPWVNLAVLNFCYHNAHHIKPNEPWYRLPRLHRELGVNDAQVMPLREQWQRYSQHRLARIDASTPATGTDGVSFLVGV